MAKALVEDVAHGMMTGPVRQALVEPRVEGEQGLPSTQKYASWHACVQIAMAVTVERTPKTQGRAMELLDEYLAHYHFHERHALDICASPARIMAAVQSYDSAEDRVVRAMIALREMPQRLICRLGKTQVRDCPPFSLDNFTHLASIPDRALALGLAGRFWKLDYGQETIPDVEAFKRFAQPGAARLVLGFSTREGKGGATELVTETRVQCLDAAALRQFRPYWYLIRPVSGLIRRRMLNAIKLRVTGL